MLTTPMPIHHVELSLISLDSVNTGKVVHKYWTNSVKFKAWITFLSCTVLFQTFLEPNSTHIKGKKHVVRYVNKDCLILTLLKSNIFDMSHL